MKMLAILMIMQIASGSALVELESRSICSIAMLASNSSPSMMMQCTAIPCPPCNRELMSDQFRRHNFQD